MPSLGPPELIIILVIVVLIFGVGKLPQIGGALGKSVREFRQASSAPLEENAAAEPSAESAATDDRVEATAVVAVAVDGSDNGKTDKTE